MDVYLGAHFGRQWGITDEQARNAEEALRQGDAQQFIRTLNEQHCHNDPTLIAAIQEVW